MHIHLSFCWPRMHIHVYAVRPVYVYHGVRIECLIAIPRQNAYMTRVTRKWTSSGFRTLLYLELSWWKYCQAHQPVNITNFTQVWIPKNCQFFKPRRGLFSHDMRHMPCMREQIPIEFEGRKCLYECTPVTSWIVVFRFKDCYLSWIHRFYF